MLYKKLIEGKIVVPTIKAQKWNEDLDINKPIEEYLEKLEIGRTCTINNKMRSFGYNFFMRNVPYQRKLYKIGIKDDNKCQDCTDSEETLLHLYWTCPSTKRLWERLKEMVQETLNLNLELSPEGCLLGLREDPIASKDRKRLVTTLCLLTKHYIHLCKCRSSSRSVRGMENYFQKIYKIERQLARNKGTEYLVNRKWGEMSKKMGE